MKQSKRILNLILALVFLVSVGMVLRQNRDNSGGESEYRTAIEIAKCTDAAAEAVPEDTRNAATGICAAGELIWMPEMVEDDPVLEDLRKTDLNALREVNPDVVGWIRIPDTKVNYPVVQGMDNQYYLKHTWKGNVNSVGAIFMDHNASPSLTDFNTLIYGHNMRSGSMFAALRSYGRQSYYDAHPYVYLLTDNGAFRFEIFSAHRAELDDPAYGLSFRQRETRENFLRDAADKSAIETGITPGIRDRILTLSTCSGAGYETRWVVQARLKMEQMLCAGE